MNLPAVEHLDQVEITVEPWSWPLAKARRAEIDAHFADLKRRRSVLWNGRVLMLHSCASLNRPSANVTGVSFLTSVLGAKRLELLHQLVPTTTTIAMLVNPNTPTTEAERKEVQAAAQAIQRKLVVLDVVSEYDLQAAFETSIQRGAGAMIVGTGAFLNSYRKRIVALMARYRLPAGYNLRDFVTEGGLMSYGPSITEAYRQVGIYAGRILKGEKPANLPVMQSSKFEFVINLKTARALGLTIPPTLLALADEVVE